MPWNDPHTATPSLRAWQGAKRNWYQYSQNRSCLNRPLYPIWGKLINIDSIKITLYEASQVPPFWWTGYYNSKCLCCRGHYFFNFHTELFLFSLVLISE
jgi:hypothetical protein